MPKDDFRRCTVTLPSFGLVIDGLLTGDEIQIRQGNQILRIPGRAPELQEVIDGILSVNAAITREAGSRKREEVLRAKESECASCSPDGKKPSL